MKLNVFDLTCEYLKDPVGLDVEKPRFSWKLESDKGYLLQIAYQLQLALDESFEQTVYDSGRVDSSESVLVEYMGPKLCSCTRYYYRVRVWSNFGNESAFSVPALFETAFLSREEWKAKWISQPDEGSACSVFRKTFTLKGKVKSARLYSTALGVYDLELNGRPVGEDILKPGFTSYNKHLLYQTYDVTEHLRQGENALGATVGNGWYKSGLTWEMVTDCFGPRRALLAQLQVEYEDGSRDMVMTDESWKTTCGPTRMAEIYHGETYDARLEMPGWSAPGFDDEAWKTVQVLEHSYDMLSAQNTVTMRVMDEVRPVEIIKTPAGETVIDFGQNMVGFVQFKVEGKAGDRVVYRHAEVLDKDGNFYLGNIRKARNEITYILKGEGEEVFHPRFSFQGFRYIKLYEFPGEPKLENFTGLVVYSDMQTTGKFTCSDPMVNQLQHNIYWGQRGNFLDVPTDCPQRDERLGWTGDAQMFVRTACYNMNVASFFTKWLQDLKADQTLEYGVPHVVPNVLLHGCNSSSSAWGDAAVICPWTIYLCYGDKRILENQYGSMKLWIEYMRRQGENEYLYNTGFHYGDWLALDAQENSYVGATPKDLIATAFFAYSSSLVAKTADILGNEEDAKRYGELFEKIKENFQKEFVTPNGRVAARTQTAQVLVLMFDLVDAQGKRRAIETLCELLKENDYHLTTGFVGTPYLCHVLSRYGRHDVACKLLLQKDYPSWLYPITKGATTIWEHWDGIKLDGSFWSDDMNSFNHYAYGSIGDWMYRVVCGINADEKAPGYRHFFITPKPVEEFEYAKAEYQSMYGTIRSSWKRCGDKVCYHVSVPANTSATVQLARTSLTVGSGEYDFEEPVL